MKMLLMIKIKNEKDDIVWQRQQHRGSTSTKKEVKEKAARQQSGSLSVK